MDEQILKKAGLKATPRRKEMLLILLNSDCPLTAEEVYHLLSQKQSCDLSTVYRALNTMAERRLLQKNIHRDGRIYYQLHLENHSHRLVCERCHESVPIDLCPLEQLERDLRENTGYRITGHQFEISGVCPRCAEKERENK